MKRLPLVIVGIALLGVSGSARQLRRVGFAWVKPPISNPWLGVGCNTNGSDPSGTSGCIFATSFLSSEGWTADAGQVITGGSTACGYSLSFAGVQANIGTSGNNVASGGTACQNADQVITAANHTTGLGGRGFRHMRGGNSDNNNGGGFNVGLTGSPTTFQFSYAMRYAAGYTTPGTYTKDFYFQNGGEFPFGYQGGAFGFDIGGTFNSGGTASWSSIYGGTTADGTWHCFDANIAMGSSTITIWVDGVQSFHSTTQSFTGSGTTGGVQWGNNQSQVHAADGTAPLWTDFDDLRISTGLTSTQRVGCVGNAS